MTRQRIVEPGFPHHLILRGNNRRIIASFASDFRRLLCLMLAAALDTGCLVLAGALLSNHLHLIVTPPDADALPRFVRHWAQRYARRRNLARGGSGKLFEQRYSSKALRDDAALAAATRYVDLNPVRAGCVTAPEAYRWSTAALHLGCPESDWPAELWHPSPWYVALATDDARRAELYRGWLELDLARGDDELSPVEDAAHACLHYGRRLRRPDGTRACDGGSWSRWDSSAG
jgi:putative transposase